MRHVHDRFPSHLMRSFGRRPAFTGAPHEQHRAARRLAAGWRPSDVARVLECPPDTIYLLLREPEFIELFRAFRELTHLAPEERLARLEELALVLLEEGLAEGDRRVAAFVVRERQRGHNPAATLARGIAAAVEREREAATRDEDERRPPPRAPSGPKPAADPVDRALWRTAANLRGSVVREHAAQLDPLPKASLPPAESTFSPVADPTSEVSARPQLQAKPQGP